MDPVLILTPSLIPADVYRLKKKIESGVQSPDSVGWTMPRLSPLDRNDSIGSPYLMNRRTSPTTLPTKLPKHLPYLKLRNSIELSSKILKFLDETETTPP